MNSHYPTNDAEMNERSESHAPKFKRPRVSNYQWAVGVLFTVVIGLGSWSLMSISTLQSRTAAAEARIENTHDDLEKVDGRLIRIEDKLDRIIEQGVHIRTEVSPRSRALTPEPAPPKRQAP